MKTLIDEVRGLRSDLRGQKIFEIHDQQTDQAFSKTSLANDDDDQLFEENETPTKYLKKDEKTRVPRSPKILKRTVTARCVKLFDCDVCG